MVQTTVVSNVQELYDSILALPATISSDEKKQVALRKKKLKLNHTDGNMRLRGQFDFGIDYLFALRKYIQTEMNSGDKVCIFTRGLEVLAVF